MAAINDIMESWEGHTHEEVEEALKAKFAELEGGDYTKISIGIPDGTSRKFASSAEDITFTFTVDCTTGGVYDANFIVRYEIKIDNIVVETVDVPNIGNTSADTIFTSINLVPYFAKYINRNTIDVVISAYNTDGIISKARTIRYTRIVASLSFRNEIGAIDPAVVPVITSFNSSSAELKATFYTKGKGDQTTTTLTSSEAVNINVPSNLDAGSHKVEAYLEVDGIKSETVSTYIFTTKNAKPDDVYISVSDVKGAKEKQYVDIKFVVLDPNLPDDSKITVTFEVEENGVFVKKGSKDVTNKIVDVWRYLVQSTNNTIRVGIPNSSGVLREYQIINFTAEASNINWSAKDNALIYLTAQSRSNSDTNKDVWESNGYSVKFDNVQFDNNTGWADNNHLHLVGTAKATIKDFYPFYKNTPRGILDTGLTIKMSFKVSGVSDPNKEVISCYAKNSDGKTGVGFYVTGDSLYIEAGTSGLISRPDEVQSADGHNSRKFSADTRIDLTIAIQPYNSAKKEVRYYINGEIAGFGRYTTEALSQVVPTEIVFGGEGAALDLYDFRYYAEYLDAFDVLQTRTMDLDDVSEITEIVTKNDFYELPEGQPVITLKEAIKYGKYLAEQKKGKPNFAVVVCTDFCNDYPNNITPVGNVNRFSEGSAFVGSTSATNGYDKQNWYIYKFKLDNNGKGVVDDEESYWIEGAGEHENWSNGERGGTLRIRRQGTSTAKSTKGNIRLDARGEVRIHKFNSITEAFYEEYTVAGKSSDIFRIPDNNAIPCYLLTMKKNPNESTQARNLPCAKMYEDGARYLAAQSETYEDCLTPPQRKELASIKTVFPDESRSTQISRIKTRQCVDGIPSIAFEIKRVDWTDADGAAKLTDPTNGGNVTLFSGQFDLITDKTNMKVFGFGGYWTWDNADGDMTWHKDEVDETFSVEFRENASAICNFHTADISRGGVFTSDGGEGLSHLEYRYPDKDAVCGDIIPSSKENASNVGLTLDGPMQRLFDFVYNCSPNNIGKQANKGNITASNQITVEGESKEDDVFGNNRKDKFYKELKYYCVVNQIIFNWVMIDNNLMCDQNTKNQFFSFFTGDVDTISDYTGTKQKQLRLLGYDFDSSLGCDNDNYFKFMYNVKYEDGLYDGKESGRGPDFWELVYEQFATEIKEFYNLLFKGGIINAEGILNYMHNNQVDLYNAMIYNANSEYSYTSIQADYEKAHGSAKEHNTWFVKNRAYFKGGENYSNNTSTDFSGDATNINVSSFENIEADNKFWYTEDGNTDIQNLKSKGYAINLTAYERAYSYLIIGNTLYAGAYLDVKDIVENNIITGKNPTTVTLKAIDNNGKPISHTGGGDFRISLIGCNRLKNIGDLSHWYIREFANGWDNLKNLEEINVGRRTIENNGEQYDYKNNALTTDGLNFSNTVFGCCKKANLAGLVALTGTLNMTNFPILEELDLYNDSGLTGLNLPSTENLKVLSLPANLTYIILENKKNITTLEFQGTDNISQVTANNCNNYVAQLVIDKFL